MRLPISQPVHQCKCRRPVAETQAEGVAILSENEIVQSKLAQAFPAFEGSAAVRSLDAEGWLESLNAFLATLSPIERQVVRAAPIDASGNFNPWSAIPVVQLIERLNTPWFPSMLNGGQMVSHLQPIANTRDGTTFGFEALARATVDGKLLNGGQIIDAAKAHSALFQFDQIGRTQAIRSCGPKLRAGEKLFINFIPMVIYDPALCLQTCWEAATEVNVSLDQLVFEVVESEQFPDIAHLKRILETYQARGAEVALDDLGTGHTALSYIDELSPNYVKLAKGLIPANPVREDLNLVKGLVEHAKERSITVLAEGIETSDQLAACVDLGIDLVQGWYIGKPALEPVRSETLLRRAA